MSEQKQVDKKHLKKLAEAIDHILGFLQSERNTMLDDDEDLFDRYFAHARLVAVVGMFSNVMDMSKTMFRLGTDLKCDQLQTKKCKKHNWHNKDEVKGNPFFVDEGNDDDDDEDDEPTLNGIAIKASELPEELKSALGKLFVQAIRGKK